MKLHIGCGNKYLDGYKHVDVYKYKHIDFTTDAKDLSMILDNEVDEIYACHVLEHFHKDEIKIVLKEWYRVLKKGGVLRLAVPNFEMIVEEYSENKNLNKLLGLLYGGQNYKYNFHYTVFDYKLLKQYLEENNFIDINYYDWKEFLPENFDDFSRAYLPHMDFENGRSMSLNVTARKK